MADDAPTTNQNQYSLSAEADGMYFDFSDAGFNILTSDLAVSPYSAEASLDSNANSTALAGLPYLGPVLETIGGTVNGLSGGTTPPLPPAPGYVTSSYPQSKTATEAQGPYLLLVNSGAYESDASAGAGVSPNAGSTNQQIFSKSQVIANPDGSVDSKASAGVDGLNVGPIDALNVSSTAEITSTGTGAPTITQNSSLGSFTILGFTIGLTSTGFSVLGGNVALPVSTVLATVDKALASAGVTISVFPSVTTLDKVTGGTSVTTGGVQLTMNEDVPTQGPTLVTYTYGRATVSAEDVALSGDDSDGGLTDTTSSTAPSTDDAATTVATPEATTASAAPIPTDATTTTVAPVTAPSAVTAPVATDAALPPTVDTAGSDQAAAAAPVVAPVEAAPAPEAAAAPVRTLGFTPTIQAALGTNSRGLYMVLVLAGLAALAGQQIFRVLGIRLLNSRR